MGGRRGAAAALWRGCHRTPGHVVVAAAVLCLVIPSLPVASGLELRAADRIQELKDSVTRDSGAGMGDGTAGEVIGVDDSHNAVSDKEYAAMEAKAASLAKDDHSLEGLNADYTIHVSSQDLMEDAARQHAFAAGSLRSGAGAEGGVSEASTINLGDALKAHLAAEGGVGVGVGVDADAEAEVDAETAAEAYKASREIIFGRTTPGSTPWRRWGWHAVYVDVDTTAAGFTATPTYVVSLNGKNYLASRTKGGSSYRHVSSRGFRVAIHLLHGSVWPSRANAWGWHINWAGTQNTKYGGKTPVRGTPWQQYGWHGLWTNVDTRSAGLSGKQINLVTSLSGDHYHELCLGSSQTYNVGANGFRSYIYNTGRWMRPWIANSWRWSINWIATWPGRLKYVASGTANGFTGGTHMTIAWKANKKFPMTPVYLTSVSGDSSHWTSRGPGTAYEVSNTGGKMMMYYSVGSWNARRYHYKLHYVAGMPYVDMLKADVKALTTTVTKLNSKVSGLSGQDKALRSKVASAKSEVNQVRSKVSETKREQSTIERDTQALGFKEASLQAAIKKIAAEGQQFKREVDQKTRKLREQVTSLQEGSKRETETQQTLVKDVDTFAKQLTGLQAQQLAANRENAMIVSKTGPAKLDLETTQGRLTTRTEALKRQVAELTALHGSVSQGAEAASKKLADAKAQYASLEGKRNHIAEETDAINRKIEDSKAITQQMYQDADSARTELSNLRKQYTERTSEYHHALDDEEAERARLEEATTLLQDQVDRVTDKSKEAAAELAKLESTAATTKAEWERKISEAQSKLHKVQSEVEVLRHVVSEAQQQITDRKGRVGSTEERVEELEKRQRETESKLHVLEERRHSLLGSIHSLASKASMAAQDASENAEEQQKLEAASRKKKNELDELKLREQTTLSGPQIINVVTAAGQRSKGGAGGAGLGVSSAPAVGGSGGGGRAVAGSTAGAVSGPGAGTASSLPAGAPGSPASKTAPPPGGDRGALAGVRVDSHPFVVNGPSHTVSNTFVVREGKASVGNNVVSETP